MMAMFRILVFDNIVHINFNFVTISVTLDKGSVVNIIFYIFNIITLLHCVNKIKIYIIYIARGVATYFLIT